MTKSSFSAPTALRLVAINDNPTYQPSFEEWFKRQGLVPIRLIVCNICGYEEKERPVLYRLAYDCQTRTIEREFIYKSVAAEEDSCVK